MNSAPTLSYPYRLILAWGLFMVFTFWPVSYVSAFATDRSPSDVYLEVQHLAGAVRKLQSVQGITKPWPHVVVEPGHEPRHVFQKALEILNKINRYRVKLVETGAITIPRFPGRDITPDEVYGVVVRLHQELDLLVGASLEEEKAVQQKPPELVTPSHVYAALSEVSIALEATLGLRSIGPSEVYLRSLQVVELASFLRRSQGLSSANPKPPKTEGKLPNHALGAVHQLLSNIQAAENNLWIKPLVVPKLARRVINPSDVYDAMGIALAELQRIQYRLGLEREFKMPSLVTGKTPDDVIQNTLWAAALLPSFELGKPLQQYDRTTLKKTFNQAYSVTEHTLNRLTQYRHLRGIRTQMPKAQLIGALKPRHVYRKVLANMEKVDLLRRRLDIGAISVPRYPRNSITESEVFDVVLRLDQELGLVHQLEGNDVELWGITHATEVYEGKSASDVFYNLQCISNLLDSIIGPEGFAVDDIYRMASSIKQDVVMIANQLDIALPEIIFVLGTTKMETQQSNLVSIAGVILDLIGKTKKRAGMFDGFATVNLVKSPASLPGLYNQVRRMKSELTEIKVFLGIDSELQHFSIDQSRNLGHVLQLLEGVRDGLMAILRLKERE